MTPQRLEQAGLNYLARFAASAAHLRRVLSRRVSVSATLHETDSAALMQAVDALIGRWIASGVLDDAGYAAAKAASLHRRGIPRQRISGTLREKGIATPLIERALGDESEIGSDLAAAIAFARRRRLGPYRPDEQRQGHYNKDLGRLARAGFDRRTAQAVLDAGDVEALAGLIDD